MEASVQVAQNQASGTLPWTAQPETSNLPSPSEDSWVFLRSWGMKPRALHTPGKYSTISYILNS